jgi:hypothetical protein
MGLGRYGASVTFEASGKQLRQTICSMLTVSNFALVSKFYYIKNKLYMTPKLMLFLVSFSTIFVSCQKDIEDKSIKKVETNTDMKGLVFNQLKNQKCELFLKFPNGLIPNNGYNVEKLYLYSNVICNWYQDTTQKILYHTNHFSFAYQDTTANVTHLVLYHLYAEDSVLELKIDIKKDSTYTTDLLFTNSKGYNKYLTQKSKLVLDKINYNVGDTLYGYTLYQGLEKKDRMLRNKLEYCFKCVVGKSSNPLDYVDTYEKCR